jgi:phenylacetate-CoA ligase
METKLLPDAIEQLANEGVTETFSYVYSHSPFYRKRIETLDLGLHDIKSTEDLKLLPLTSKKDIAEAGRDLWCVPNEQIVDISTTSGTTGLPTLYPMTENDIKRLGYNEFLSFSCVGLTERDVVLSAVTMDRCFMAGLAYFEGLRKRAATTIRIGIASPIMLLSMMQRLEATAVVSVPSFLKKVAGYAEVNGIDLKNSSVSKLVCIGEPVRTDSFELTAMGKQIAQKWGAKVYSTYGVTELATSACECDVGCGGHIHPQLLYVEILDENGQAVPDGQVGEIVATSIGVEAMPLLRFQTGDCSFIVRHRCECGLWTPRLGPILGRKNQMLKIKGTTVYPTAVHVALEQIEGIEDYVMIASTKDLLSDELEVVVATHKDATNMRRTVQEHLQGALKVTPLVRITSCEEIQFLKNGGGLQEFRKNRVFIDHRQTGDDRPTL